MDLKEEEIIGPHIDRHWYYVSKARMLADHIEAPVNEILDVGAGGGWFSKWLISNGHARNAVLVDPGYECDRDEVAAPGSTLRFRRSIETSNADLALFMDVLEHVDDDAGLLAEYIAKTKPGTRFFITVPAFQFLWSAHDEFLEHRRRYTLASLEKTIRAAGAEPESLHYYFGSIFPAAALVRLLQRGRKADRSDMKPAAPVINSALRGVCSLERKFMNANKIAGLSVVGMFRR